MKRKWGIGILGDHLGGKKRGRVHNPHFVKSEGKSIRYCLQQLAKMDLIRVIKGKKSKKIKTVSGLKFL